MKQLLSFLIVLAVSVSVKAQRTPTMGWSSWNTFALNINEELIKGQADAMHNSGLQAAGFKYINIDDGYWNGRADDGNLRLNLERFPNGMRKLVDYIHSLGLKAGIYSDAGDNTCGSGNRHAWGIGVGLANHEKEDCHLYFIDWDFDFIKIDYCGGNHMRLDEREQYTKISKAIKECGKKDIVFNICRWAYPGNWAADICDSWRTTGDINSSWRSVRNILAENLYMAAYCHDGHYNDMDMLETGRTLSEEEDKTHFGMWCIMSSPLLIGCDMAKINPTALKLMCNTDLIALNQDPLHLQAYISEKQNGCFVMVKDILKERGNTRAFAIYNPTDEEKTVSLDMTTLELGGDVELFDCFAQQNVAGVKSGYKKDFTVPAHGTLIYRATCQDRVPRTVYEAETAWLSSYQEIRNNQAQGTAVYTADENCSGGYKVEWLGNKDANDIQWKNVYADKAGKYVVKFTYLAGEDRNMDLYVNGKKQTTLSASGQKGWSEPSEIQTVVKLKKGNNIIRLANSKDWMPNIDCMTVVAE